MTSKLISVSAVGVNRIGTHPKYFKAISNNNGNIQNSSLYNHNNIFVMNANIEYSRDANLNFLYYLDI
jgi:glycine cleavage system regulatory protein